MSIVTKTGDRGTTGLMYNRRVSKCDPRVEAYGSVDELNAALGLARAAAKREFIRRNLLLIQRDLVTLMGELATHVDDLDRYVRDGFNLTTSELTARLDALVKRVETEVALPKDWVMPGMTIDAAALDFARTVCRRAERHLCQLDGQNQLRNPEMIVYLNRLSDLLWLLARWVESKASRRAGRSVRDGKPRARSRR